MSVGGGEADPAPALGPSSNGLEGVAVGVVLRVPELGEGSHAVRSQGPGGEEPHLKIRLVRAGSADKGTVVAADRSELALAAEEPLEDRDGIVELGPLDPQLARHTDPLLGRLKGHDGCGVVLKVLSDTREVRNDGDGEVLEVLLGPDSGRHEDLGRGDGSCGQDDLAALGQHGGEICVGVVSDDVVSHADGGSRDEIDMSDHGTRADLEILTLEGLLEEGSGTALPTSIPLGDLEPPSSLLLPVPVVEIVVVSEQLSADFEELLAERVLVADLAHRPLPPLGVVLGAVLGPARRVVLGLQEVREHVVAAPPVAPLIVVSLGSAVVQQDVRARRPPEDLSASQKNVPPRSGLVPLGLVLPVEAALEQPQDPGGYLDEFVLVVCAARLEEQDPLAWVLGKALC
mmetsp:Transcript_19000/g.38001  ORF Transcript_19000/g.38001 Transcript_19000/m.38001 type:complete len:402 (-) Transcript_19000:175-1380(-)